VFKRKKQPKGKEGGSAAKSLKILKDDLVTTESLDERKKLLSLTDFSPRNRVLIFLWIKKLISNNPEKSVNIKQGVANPFNFL